MSQIPLRRLVSVDESGANRAMGRSRVWVRRWQELVEVRPMNWGDTLTLVGPMRTDRWLTLRTQWGATNAKRFVDWVRYGLAPRLRRGEVVVFDNLTPHKDPRVEALIAAHGAQGLRLP